MHNLKSLIFIVAIMCVSPSFASAQGSAGEWGILNQVAMDLYRQGEYYLAVAVAQKALKVAEENFGEDHPYVSASLDNLAGVYGAQGNYEKAEALLTRSLAISDTHQMWSHEPHSSH